MLGYVVAHRATRRLPKQRRSTSGTFRPRASEVGLTWLVVAIDEPGAIVASGSKRKRELIALFTQIALKGRSSGVIRSCFAVR